MTDRYCRADVDRDRMLHISCFIFMTIFNRMSPCSIVSRVDGSTSFNCDQTLTLDDEVSCGMSAMRGIWRDWGRLRIGASLVGSESIFREVAQYAADRLGM